MIGDDVEFPNTPLVVVISLFLVSVGVLLDNQSKLYNQSFLLFSFTKPFSGFDTKSIFKARLCENYLKQLIICHTGCIPSDGAVSLFHPLR